MRNLRVSTWEQWETITCHFMQKWAKEIFGVAVSYETYGSRGQSQFGIDVVPSSSKIPFVAQSKLKERSFTWDDALEEVRKTDGYPNPIQLYVVFTTAPIHTTVQDQRNNAQYFHTRPDCSRFRVEVRYWGEMDDISFIPRDVLARLFPEISELVARTSPAQPTKDELLKSVKALKSNLPRWLTKANLLWLENWNFAQGYIYEADFQPFRDLFYEHDRALHALNGVPEWMTQGDRASIAECLPAGADFFAALSDFNGAISSHSIAQGSVGTVLTLDGLDDGFASKVAREWKSSAAELARIYRRDVLGQSMSF
ncbi:hypothetical protein [Massilia aurea]|uniref:hypothetical protein n=1 Tax=Massilia aurea TaxID=373040 RepID=UPI0011CD6A14|nr:hypothetical protein [Massilia aurea]